MAVKGAKGGENRAKWRRPLDKSGAKSYTVGINVDVVHTQEETMNNAQLKQLAKAKLKGNWGVALAVLLVAGVLSAAASSAFGIIELVIVGPLTVGVCSVFVSLFRKGSAQFEDMFGGFRNFFNNFITGLLVNVFIALWSMLFIIPGIIKTYAYAMTFYIQNDHPEMTETDAITASREMMRGHKMELFLLDLSFIGWYLLSALTFGVLLLYVLPYHNAARTAFYEELIGNSSQPANDRTTDATTETEPKQEDTALPYANEDIVNPRDDNDGGETLS